MSAWIVSKEHVAALIRFYCCGTRAQIHTIRLDDTGIQAAGMLYAQNVRSVNHRYENHVPEEPVAFTTRDLFNAPKLTPVEAIKACQCLEYQSCETEDWRETEAYRLVRRIQSCAISCLPGYDDAAWGIDVHA